MIDGQEASERVWLVLDALASAHPDMPLKDGVLLAQKVYREVNWMREEGVSDPPTDPGQLPPASWTPQVLGAWAGRQKVVTDFLPDKKINAIKELRGLSGSGLKEAKEAVEWLMDDLGKRGML
jgi:hypothetical protein